MPLFPESNLKLEKAVRSLLDSGELYSQTEIQTQLPKFKSDEISAVLRKIMTGGLYTIQQGKYGRKSGT